MPIFEYRCEDCGKDFEKLGITEIWVTPKVPFMIPLLIGFLFSFIIGDILFYIINF